MVTGYKSEPLIKNIEPDLISNIQIIHNHKFKEGLSSSIIRGLNSAGQDYDYYGFCNADKPFIQSQTIDQLLLILKSEKPGILVPEYNGLRGHPVFFGNQYYQPLTALKGDSGARNLICENNSEVFVMSTEDKGIITDMDKFLESN